MVTVALIGADGAGKSTLIRSLERSPELPIRSIYMGVNSQAGNHLLPTTRVLRRLRSALGVQRSEGGPPDPDARRKKRRGLRGMTARVRSTLALGNRMCEEWYRLQLARRFERRGFLVLFDRHCYADYWAHDVIGGQRSLEQRLHGAFLARLPRPDCTILLDAPAEVLFARKPEGTLERIARRRREYLDLCASDQRSVVVDATRPRAEVAATVLDILQRLYRSRGGHETCTRPC